MNRAATKCAVSGKSDALHYPVAAQFIARVQAAQWLRGRAMNRAATKCAVSGISDALHAPVASQFIARSRHIQCLARAEMGTPAVICLKKAAAACYCFYLQYYDAPDPLNGTP